MGDHNQPTALSLTTIGVMTEEILRWQEYRAHCQGCRWHETSQNAWGHTVEHLSTYPDHVVALTTTYRSVNMVRRRP